MFDSTNGSQESQPTSTLPANNRFFQRVFGSEHMELHNPWLELLVSSSSIIMSKSLGTFLDLFRSRVSFLTKWSRRMPKASPTSSGA